MIFLVNIICIIEYFTHTDVQHDSAKEKLKSPEKIWQDNFF